MKIAVIAANGRTGVEFVQMALEANHVVKAGIRGKNNLPKHPSLEVVNCDATDKYEVLGLISGVDAVASFIGHTKNSIDDLQTTTIKNVISACEKNQVKRLVSLTGTGVRQQDDKITFLDKLLNFGVLLVDRKRVVDGRDHVRELEKSELDYTVLRVLKLTNGEFKDYKLSKNGPAMSFVPRKTAANAAMRVIEKSLYIRDLPIITDKN